MIYIVDVSDTARDEILSIYECKREISIEGARNWYNGLIQTLESLE